MVFLYVACVAVYCRISKYDNHDNVPTIQLHDVCRMSLHSVLLTVAKNSGRFCAPRLTVDVKDPQLICDIAVACFDSASIHEDVFLQVKTRTSEDKTVIS